MSKNLLLTLFVFFVYSVPVSYAQAVSSKKPAKADSKSAAAGKKKKAIKPKYDFNRRHVPVKDRLVRDWGGAFGVRYSFASGFLSAPHHLDLVVKGYKCFALGSMCLSLGITTDIMSWPLQVAGFGFVGGLEWNPLTNRHWLGLYGDFGLQWLPIRVGDDATRVYGDIGVQLLWRAFGDNALSAFKIKAGLFFGAEIGRKVIFAAPETVYFAGVGITILVDVAGMLYGKGGSISIFSGNSTNRPTGYYQELNNWGTVKHVKDTDGDGVADTHDKCPTIPGPVENHGCPRGDRDGDGIADNIDKCPNEPGPMSNMGCPLKKKSTSKPSTAAPRSFLNSGNTDNGNTETYAQYMSRDDDGDGIQFKDDQCPLERGPKWNCGCPYSWRSYRTRAYRRRVPRLRIRKRLYRRCRKYVRSRNRKIKAAHDAGRDYKKY